MGFWTSVATVASGGTQSGGGREREISTSALDTDIILTPPKNILNHILSHCTLPHGLILFFWNLPPPNYHHWEGEFNLKMGSVERAEVFLTNPCVL